MKLGYEVGVVFEKSTKRNDRDIEPQHNPYKFRPMRGLDSPHLTPKIHDSERLRAHARVRCPITASPKDQQPS
jgi:hypothetical protein